MLQPHTDTTTHRRARPRALFQRVQLGALASGSGLSPLRTARRWASLITQSAAQVNSGTSSQPVHPSLAPTLIALSARKTGIMKAENLHQSESAWDTSKLLCTNYNTIICIGYLLAQRFSFIKKIKIKKYLLQFFTLTTNKLCNQNS